MVYCTQYMCYSTGSVTVSHLGRGRRREGEGGSQVAQVVWGSEMTLCYSCLTAEWLHSHGCSQSYEVY